MPRTPTSGYYAKQLTLKYKFALFVFFPGLICFVIFPADCFVALFAFDVSHDVPTCGHITFHRLSLFDIHHGREEEGFAMLASEVPRNDIVEVGEMGFAVLQLRIWLVLKHSRRWLRKRLCRIWAYLAAKDFG